jgi:hypothetical protein
MDIRSYVVLPVDGLQVNQRYMTLFPPLSEEEYQNLVQSIRV